MRITIALLIAALRVLPAMAEPPSDGSRPEKGQRPSPEQRIDRHMSQMTERLELTESQRAEIRPILEDTASRLGTF